MKCFFLIRTVLIVQFVCAHVHKITLGRRVKLTIRQRNLTDAHPGKVSRPNVKQDLATGLLLEAQHCQSRHWDYKKHRFLKTVDLQKGAYDLDTVY